MSMPADLTASDGPGPQTPLGRDVTTPTARATDPTNYGTDSGLSGSATSFAASNPGAALGGRSDPGRVEPDLWTMGTDSGLVTSPSSSLARSQGVDEFEQPAPPADPLDGVQPGRTSLNDADVNG